MTHNSLTTIFLLLICLLSSISRADPFPEPDPSTLPQISWVDGSPNLREGDSSDNVRLTAEITLAPSGEPVIFTWPSGQTDTISRLRIWGDRDDNGIVHLDLAAIAEDAVISDSTREERYRLWPSVDGWSEKKEESLTYSVEFQSLPGWNKRWFRIAVDFTTSGTRIWIDGRMIWSQPKSPGCGTRLNIVLPKGADKRRLLLFSLPEKRFLPLDLSSYYNNDALKGGDLGDGFAFANDLLLGHGMANISEIPFYVEWLQSQNNNCDLGMTDCRGYLPYIHCDALSSDPKRVLLRVPKRYYDRAHLVCAADKQEKEIRSAAIRMIKTGRGHEITATYDVPYWDDKKANPVPLDCGLMDSRTNDRNKSGTMWLVSVPLNPSDFQDFLAAEDETFLELDLTKLIGFDSQKYPRPMGPPSSVHIFALTLEEAPAQMVVTSDAIGHIFEDPQQPVMQVQLKSQRTEKQEYELIVDITDPCYARTQERYPIVLGPYESRTERISLPNQVKGKYDVSFRLVEREGTHSALRSTSYAVLPRYRRQATEDSPFGVWCFFEQHYGVGPEIAGPLLKLLGARWTLPNFLCRGTPEENAERVELLGRYGVIPAFGYLCGIHNTGYEGPGDVEAKIRELRATPWVKNYNVFWETSAGKGTTQMIPPEIMGKSPYELNEQEIENLKNCQNTGVAYSRRVKEEFPDAKLIFGNGFPFFIACMLHQGYPSEYIDGFGLDFDLYTSMPERQPSIPYAPFNGLFFLKRIQEFYGYQDIPIYLTEAVYAPAAPGWLTEREQADHYIRTYLLAMAAGVKYFGMCTEVWDPGGWFGYGHYGPVGFCHRPPELNPRESFCAYATMTAMLDRCRYERTLPMGSPGVFGIEFLKSDNRPVYALWTIRGERPVTLRMESDAEATITDCFGNKEIKNSTERSLDILLTSSPLYIEGINSITGVVLGDPEYKDEPDKTETLVGLDSLKHWTQEKNGYEILENIKPTAPLIAADLTLTIRQSKHLAHKSLSVGLPSNVNWHPIETAYTVLKWNGPDLRIPDSASSIGTWVYGNSSWGRILFELKDAEGRKWLSAHSESSFVDFDGYHYIGVDLPRAPQGKRVEPIGFRPWVCDVDKAEPVYPMTLTRLIVEARSHIIRGGDIEAVPVPEYDIERLVYVVADSLQK